MRTGLPRAHLLTWGHSPPDAWPAGPEGDRPRLPQLRSHEACSPSNTHGHGDPDPAGP